MLRNGGVKSLTDCLAPHVMFTLTGCIFLSLISPDSTMPFLLLSLLAGFSSVVLITWNSLFLYSFSHSPIAVRL